MIGRIKLSLGIAFVAIAVLTGCERPRPITEQTGYRGTGMVELTNKRTSVKLASLNALPEASAQADPNGPKAGALYKNVQVLGDQSVGEFTRTMLAMTSWVAPNEGCNYCHKAGEDFSADTLYTKIVARKMLAMTGKINADWGQHVGATGVTCYTCHRGNNIPKDVWYSAADPGTVKGFTGWKYGQNTPVAANGYSSLPLDSLSSYLANDGQVRIQGATALPANYASPPMGNKASIANTEWNYSLMMHMSSSLGVNCTFCHNTQSFRNWDTSTPQRVTAWHGLRMVRDLNNGYLTPLESVFPDNRKGQLGDVAKVGCVTCHQGVNKPLNGAQMLAEYPELKKIGATVAVTAPPVAGAVTTAAAPANVLGKIYFSSGKNDIDAAGKEAIATAAKALASNAAATIDISGFADSTGNADQNMELGKQRALAVRDALKAAGVAESRINMKKPEFVVGSATADSRRVDLVAVGM